MHRTSEIIGQFSSIALTLISSVVVVGCSRGLEPPGGVAADAGPHPFAIGGSSAPGYIAADTDNVYWVDLGGTVYSASVTGGAQRVLATHQVSPMQIAVDNGEVFWVNEGSGEITDSGIATDGAITVMKWAPGADSPSEIFSTPYGYPAGLVVTSEQVILAMTRTNTGAFEATGEIISIPRDGSSPTVLASVQAYTARVAVDGTRVYWTNAGMPTVDTSTGINTYHNGSVQSVPIVGGAITSLASANFTYGPLAVGHSLYLTYSDGQNLTLLQCPLSGCGSDNSDGIVLLSGVVGGGVPTGIVNDGDNLYYPQSNGTTGQIGATGRIMKLVPGSDPFAFVSDIGDPCGIALNAKYLFWTDGCASGYGASGGVIWRLPK